MPTRVIGLGQAAAGDDGVGLAVVEELRRRGVPSGVELLLAAEDSALVSLLHTDAAVVLVDAVLARPAGVILQLTPAQLTEHGSRSVSTHGLGVCRAIELARVLDPDQFCASIRIVGVTIAEPQLFQHGLSPLVAAAVAPAADQVMKLLEI